MKRFFLLFPFLFLAACSSCPHNYADDALREAKYTHVQTGGSVPEACPSDEYCSAAFIAIDPFGEEVNGAVCCHRGTDHTKILIKRPASN